MKVILKIYSKEEVKQNSVRASLNFVLMHSKINFFSFQVKGIRIFYFVNFITFEKYTVRDW